MVLRHLVFLKIKDNQKIINLIYQNLKKLSEMPGCCGFQFGKCSDESNYHFFYMDFDNEKARDNYLIHPDHVFVAQNIVIPNLEDGLNSIKVVDFMQDRSKASSISGPGSSAYFLIEKNQLKDAFNELFIQWDHTRHIESLDNLSVEEVGKQFIHVMRIHFKPGTKPKQFQRGLLFNINEQEKFDLESGLDTQAKEKQNNYSFFKSDVEALKETPHEPKKVHQTVISSAL